jgi:hypothetical protein
MFPIAFSENDSDRHRFSGNLMKDDFLVATSLHNPWELVAALLLLQPQILLPRDILCFAWPLSFVRHLLARLT